MEHIAIDLGGRESQVCVRTSDGVVVEEQRCRTGALAAYLARRSPSRVVLETCSEAFAVADSAIAAGHQVRVVPATLVRSLGVGARGIKTDRRDAQVLSEVSCRIDLPSVHIPSADSRQVKAMCTMRDSLVRTRTLLSNCVRGWMRTQCVRLKSGAVETLPQRLRDKLPQLPTYVLRQLDTLDELSAKIAEADVELAAVAKQSDCARRLMTVPGVGPNTALRFISVIDEISRFDSAHKLQSYLGLVPGENSSSERTRRTGITKAGSAALRTCLVQAAWSARNCRRKDPIQLWCQDVEKRRGKWIAVIALARKLAGLLYAIWRDGSRYEASRGASTSTAA
jgi:transposase